MAWLSKLFRPEKTEAEPGTPNESSQPAPLTTRITVGDCSSCGQALRMKTHAVKPVVRLTCKCGASNELRVAKEILNSADVTAAKGARKPAAYEDPPEVKLMIESSERILEIYRAHPEGFVTSRPDPMNNEIRAIGLRLYQTGGNDLMFLTHREFQRKCNVLGAPRNLEMMWNGIGEWRG